MIVEVEHAAANAISIGQAEALRWYQRDAAQNLFRTAAAAGILVTSNLYVQSEEQNAPIPEIAAAESQGIPVTIDMNLSGAVDDDARLAESPFRKEYFSSNATLDTAKPALYRTDASTAIEATGNLGNAITPSPLGNERESEKASNEALSAELHIDLNNVNFVGAVTGTRSGIRVNVYRATTGDNADNETIPLQIDPRALDVQLDWAIEQMSEVNNGYLTKEETDEVQRLARAGQLDMTMTIVLSPDPDLCFVLDEDGNANGHVSVPGEDEDCADHSAYTTNHNRNFDTDHHMHNPIVVISGLKAYGDYGSDDMEQMTNSNTDLGMNNTVIHELGHDLAAVAKHNSKVKIVVGEQPDDGTDDEHELFVNPLTSSFIRLAQFEPPSNSMANVDPALMAFRFIDPADTAEKRSQIRQSAEAIAERIRQRGELPDVYVYPDAVIEGMPNEVVFKFPDGDDEHASKYDRSTKGHAFKLHVEKDGELVMTVIELHRYMSILPADINDDMYIDVVGETSKLRPFRDSLKIEKQKLENGVVVYDVVDSRGERYPLDFLVEKEGILP